MGPRWDPEAWPTDALSGLSPWRFPVVKSPSLRRPQTYVQFNSTLMAVRPGRSRPAARSSQGTVHNCVLCITLQTRRPSSSRTGHREYPHCSGRALSPSLRYRATGSLLFASVAPCAAFSPTPPLDVRRCDELPRQATEPSWRPIGPRVSTLQRNRKRSCLEKSAWSSTPLPEDRTAKGGPS